MPVNLYKLRKHPRRDFLLTSLAGPAANLLVAAACLALMQWTVPFVPIRRTERADAVPCRSPLGDGRSDQRLDGDAEPDSHSAPGRLANWPCVIPGMKPIGSRKMNSVWLVVLVIVIASRSLNPLFDGVIKQFVGRLPASDAQQLLHTHCMDALTACKAKQWTEVQRHVTAALAIDPRCVPARLFPAMAERVSSRLARGLRRHQSGHRPGHVVLARLLPLPCRILRQLGRPVEAEKDEAAAALLQQFTSPCPTTSSITSSPPIETS